MLPSPSLRSDSLSSCLGENPVISTSTSLLARLRTGEETQAWDRFVRLYTPVLFYWVRRQGVAADDAADLVQEVFALLVQKLPEFRYEEHGSFRGWLRTVTLNKWRDSHKRRKLPMADGGPTPQSANPR